MVFFYSTSSRPLTFLLSCRWIWLPHPNNTAGVTYIIFMRQPAGRSRADADTCLECLITGTTFILRALLTRGTSKKHRSTASLRRKTWTRNTPHHNLILRSRVHEIWRCWDSWHLLRKSRDTQIHHRYNISPSYLCVFQPFGTRGALRMFIPPSPAKLKS